MATQTLTRHIWTGCSPLVIQLCILCWLILAVSVDTTANTGPVFNSTILDITNETTTSIRPITALPENWENFCLTSERFVNWNFTTIARNEADDMYQISCYLSNQSHLYLSDFRIWQKRRLRQNTVAIKVICDITTNGFFHLPWPMKVLNLVYLDVRDCILSDYFSEYYDTSITEFPDQLRVLETRGCTIPVTVSEIHYLISTLKNSTKETECGPLSVEKMVNSGSKTDIVIDYYDFPLPDITADPSTSEGASETREDSMILDLDHQTDQLLSDSSRFTFICEFAHLRYLEESGWDLSEQHVFYILKKSLFPALKVYNLSHIDLIVVPKELTAWRSPIRGLDYLDLSHNDISHFQFTEQGVKEDGVGTINLQYNSISVLTKVMLDTFDTLESAVIDVRNNPINCSCGLLIDLFQYLQNPSLGQYEYLRDLKCSSPPSFRGRAVGSLTETEIRCKEALYVLIAVLTVALIILILVVFVTVTYRREVVILFYTRFHIALPCLLSETREDKEYDAFISYSSNDDKWVLPNLVKRLETGHGGKHAPLKLCVHHRDFEIGAAISENVVKSVESSRHTILVLSRHYVENEWCIYEFRTALYQSLLERKKHLIVIILENVPKPDLDPDLRKCLETFSSISVKDKLFWDKINYALRISHKSKTLSSQNCNPDTLPLKPQLTEANKVGGNTKLDTGNSMASIV